MRSATGIDGHAVASPHRTGADAVTGVRRLVRRIGLA
jgi:hypothetical protein